LRLSNNYHFLKCIVAGQPQLPHSRQGAFFINRRPVIAFDRVRVKEKANPIGFGKKKADFANLFPIIAKDHERFPAMMFNHIPGAGLGRRLMGPCPLKAGGRRL
jgi:hypothetical protein